MAISTAKTFYSWNVNGLRSMEKIENVLTIAKDNNVCIFGIQETFWDDEVCNVVKSKWDGVIHVSNCKDKNRRGVAILVHPRLGNNTKLLYNDSNGRLLKVRLETDVDKYDIFCVYAPNSECERIELLKEIEVNIDKSTPFFIMGDFNTIQYPIDKSLSMTYRSDKSRNYLFEFYGNNNCTDVWRYRNENRRLFSRSQYVEGILKQSRIDFVIASRDLLKEIQNIYYKYTTISDHSMICMKVDMYKHERGPGIWVHNNSILEEKDYIEKINSIIEREKQCPLYESNILTWWDNLKLKIKQHSIRYSMRRSKQHNQKYWELQKKIEHESRRVASIPDYDVSNLKKLENELEVFEKEKCRGAILRSKAKWALEGERNNKFFLQLEKHRQQVNTIKEIATPNGEIVKSTEGILKEEFDFYKSLYRKGEVNADKQHTFLSVVKQTINDEDKIYCDKKMEKEEMTDAVKGMSRNKSPGTDGLTTEFYLAFWKKIQPILFKVYEKIFEQETMSRSMRKGMITLIYKQKGDKKFLQNYRPISLLNVDYKILTRVFANRLQKVIETIINKNQTCCIPNRNISDTIASVRDLIDYCNTEDIEGYIVKVDQQKAFDRVDHSYLFNVINKFGFGNSFQKWIKIFYTNLISAVKCNGHLTQFFKIERSVRQGCPISAMLYVLAAEPLALAIDEHPEIKGIPIPNGSIVSLTYQHADDTTVTVSNRESITNLFQVFSEFEEISGSRVNVQKSEILRVGTHLKIDIPNIKILDNCIEMLGVYVGVNTEHIELLNWKNKIVKMNQIVNMWKQRNLSLLGRATVITNLLTSRIWYTLMVQSIPDWAITDIKKLCIDFLWNNRKHMVKYETIISKKDKGGLNIPDVSLKRSAFRLKSIANYMANSNGNVWTHFMSYNLSKYRDMKLKDEIFFMKLEKSEIRKLPKFYQELLIAFDDVYSHVLIEPVTKVDIHKQPLFRNHNYDVSMPKRFQDIFEISTIVKIEDIVYDVIPGFFPCQAIVDIVQDKYPDVHRTDIEKYYDILLKSIPENWKYCINMDEYMESNDTCISMEVGIDFILLTKCRSKEFYSILVEKTLKPPVSKVFWESILYNHNHDGIWKNVFNQRKPSKWIEVDFKLAHNGIFTQEKLCKIKMVDTDICPMCKKTKEDIMHMILYCDFNSKFICYIRDMLNNLFYKMNTSKFNSLDFERIFIFGITKCYENVNCHIINFILSCARYTIYTNRNLRVFQDKYIDPIKFFKYLFTNFVRESKEYYGNNKQFELFRVMFLQNNEYITLCNSNLMMEL